MPPASPTEPTILLALPDILLTSALAAALEPQCPVVASVHTWSALDDHLLASAPAVVVLDIALGRDVVLPHLSKLVGLHRRTHFVVCSAYPDPALTERVLLAGSTALIGHDVAASDLAEAICRLCREGEWPSGIGTVAVTHTVDRSPLLPLTPRLRQVADLLWLGKRQQEIVAQLGIGLSTLQRHITEIRRAYGVAEGMPGPWEGARAVRRGRKGARGEGN